MIDYSAGDSARVIDQRGGRTSIDGPNLVDGEEAQSSTPGSIVTRAQLKRAFKQTFSYGWQLAAVYFFEYVIQVTFAQLAEGKMLKCDPSLSLLSASASNKTCADHHPGWTCEAHEDCGATYYCTPPAWVDKNMYQVLAFAYQFGVLMSRSSLSIVRVKKFWVLTLLQAINFAIFFAESFLHFLPSWLLIVAMVWVGLMGGAMYVNTFANLIDDPRIKHGDREVAINVVALWVNVGIVTSSLFGIVSAQTFLPTSGKAR